MFKALTGKGATPEELANFQKRLDEAYAKQAAPPDADKPSSVQLIAQQIASIGPFTYYDHENNYFRLFNRLSISVRRDGRWVPYNGIYVGIDITMFGTLVSQGVAEAH